MIATAALERATSRHARLKSSTNCVPARAPPRPFELASALDGASGTGGFARVDAPRAREANADEALASMGKWFSEIEVLSAASDCPQFGWADAGFEGWDEDKTFFATTTRLYRILNKPGFYRNFNREIFTRRPEFCLLYEKLQKTCHSWKREALTEKYPDLCSTIREVNESVNICPNIRNSSLLNPILFRLNGTILKLRDELFVYARDNLAVVNIYIKDATVTKIRRDQKVNAVENTNETL